MTAPIAQPTIQVKDASAARKRRRRAPAGGASDDCFTCAKRGVKCDRRRPYCSQCLEVGNECSGYKTQLTWGVGVASRGKLRGLSLPVAKSAPVAREPKKQSARSRANSAAARAAANHTSTHSHSSQSSNGSLQWPEQRDEMRGHNVSHATRGPMDIPSVSQAPSMHSGPTTPYGMPSYDYMSMHHHNTSPPMHHGSWGSVGYSPAISPDGHARFNKFPLGLVTDGLSSSVSTVNSDVDYMSPISQSYGREEMPFVHSPPLVYDNYSTQQSSPAPQSPPSSINLDHSRAPTSYPGLVYTPPEHTGMTSHFDVFEAQINPKMMRECDSLNAPGVAAYHEGGLAPAQQHQHLQGNQRLDSRIPFFMDYYNNTLCPSMVFIDGPGNPFRENIMQLATNSSSLQHAICALSACNLRMRRKVSLNQDSHELAAQLLAEKQAAESVLDTEINDRALSEEYQHRNLAVLLLNQQLNDPMKASHDSVLATILLLCHYRMVESGIAKFHTQFAGVKKILSIRKAQQMTPIGELSWMEGIFAHLDALSASINDREAQLSPAFNDPSPNVHALPAGIENLVGCDRDLFQIISKLGRLNLLSQHRPVEPIGLSDGLARTQSPPTPQAPRFDGNGFGSTVDESEALNSMSRSTGQYEAQRTSFWKEWKEIRQALQNWKFDESIVAANLPGSPCASQLRDLGSLSEAFRYAALLYTERLASPTLPSGHSNFQNLVSQVVYYATSLEDSSLADKFLLWPLFVAGSECVNELQQNIMRTKCRDLMSRSGYMNSLSALEVLEKLWATDLRETEARNPGKRLNMVGRRSPFNWAKCTGSAGKDMEWIMF